MGQVSETGGTRRRTPFDLHHLPALDGLRGLAIAGVLVFHGGHLTGGYLGVDLFFVLSGFLITTLLLREWGGGGAIDLRRFWNRRARRLLPAVLAVLVGVAVYARVWATPYELDGIRGDALATTFYVANWRTMVSEHGYWDQYTAPSPLQHAWSLAIEEQLYLLWPLVVLAVLVVVRRRSPRDAAPGRGPRAVLALAAVGAVASWGWMLIGSLRGVDQSRLYMGTDTRAGSVLAGAALAAWLAWRGWAAIDRAPGTDRRDRRGPRVALEALALAAVAWLAYAWVTIEGTSDVLYRGVIPLSALAVLVLIVVAVHPVRGPVAHVLSWRPLGALGLISYGLYLWHWPVFVVFRQQQPRLGLGAAALFAAQVSVSLVFAVASYVAVERPIRRHGLAAWGTGGRRLMPAAGAAAVVVLLLATVGGRDQPTFASPGEQTADATLPTLPTVTDDPVGTTVPPTTTGTTAPPGAVAREGPIDRPAGRPPRLLVVGDSVGLYLGEGIKALPDLQIQVGNGAMYRCTLARTQGPWQRPGAPPEPEADECRQWEKRWAEAIDAFKPDAVFVEFGGPPQGAFQIDGAWYEPCSEGFQRFWRTEVEAALRVLSARGAIVFFAMTAHERFPWLSADIDERIDCVNEVYRSVAADHPDQARLVRLDRWVCPDGRDCIEEIDGVTLRDDGIHYRDEGALIAGRWVAEQIFRSPAGETGPTGAGAHGTETASAPPPTTMTTTQ